MAEMTSFPPGTPSWVDLSSPDHDDSKRFYCGLFGWTADAGDPEHGGYSVFSLRDKLVAGLAPLTGEDEPPAWTTYITVADAETTTATAKDAGATVIAAPFDVSNLGRMVVLRDPTGAYCCLWQPREHPGAGLVNEPNTLCWNELTTRDIDTARDFYRTVFGWGVKTNPFEGTVYTEWKLGDHSVGGMILMTDEWPDDVPPHWMTYFAVDDCDARADHAEELGGKVLDPPTDISPGRFATLTDPQGAVFSILQMADD